ncbi:MAG: hypothetical protein ACLRSW_15500 [Christensenellaceae bacterium]
MAWKSTDDGGERRKSNGRKRRFVGRFFGKSRSLWASRFVFGGTSMADGNIQSAAKIVAADPERRYVVVSAPGKRFGGDIKVTDLLYKCSELAEAGGAFEAEFSKIRTRFLNIEKEIGLDLGVEGMLDEIEERVLRGEGSLRARISRGTYHGRGAGRPVCRCGGHRAL